MNSLHDLLMELGFPQDPIEWVFYRGKDDLWTWEYRKNGDVIRRSDVPFRTQEICIRDASENGFSRLFSRYGMAEAPDANKIELG
jgi:hypothetical protein